MSINTQVKERPILFSAPMVQAILEGRKTQTRRIIKQQPTRQLANMKMGYFSEEPDNLRAPYQKCPYGQAGDRLWVRETWAHTVNTNALSPWPKRPHQVTDQDELVNSAIIYRADGEWEWCDEDGGHTERSYWKPSIFMPRYACRILLEITSISVERLTDIRNDDAVAEGIEVIGGKIDDSPSFRHYGDPTLRYGLPRNSFRSLWESINGPESWAADPWVWVVEFKKVTP